MRRNFKKFFKYLLLIVVTVLCTVIVFKIVRYPNYLQRNNQLISMFKDQLTENEKIDWHNYKAILHDLERKGIGERGIAVNITLDTHVKNKLYSENGFNAALSDKISVERSIPDIRHPGCKNKKYLKRLPTVSVIVPFHNEHWSTLLRTVYSVLNRSPVELLKEIILVDDGSTKDFLKTKLDDYIQANLTRVRIKHLEKRKGLIKARLEGAKMAVAEVLLFLDSHTEANVNWLPPLLEPIALNYKTCVCPFIDVIDFETFTYRAQDEGARGAFDWEFFYKRLPLLPENLANPTEPFKSPVMAGGLFAISAKFFWELGGYDEELAIWGGEQYELSFKIWQCGGQMLDAPCSRVGHIYRKFAPFPNPGIGDFIGKNYRRVAEVWMDEYAEYLYLRRPHYRSIDPGDLTKQKEVRKRLNCKPFKWFMKEVAFDLVKKYPPVEPDDFAKGKIRNVAASEYCLNSDRQVKDEILNLKKCQSNGKQSFTLSWHKDIRIGDKMCLDVSKSDMKSPTSLYPCHGMKGNQYWKYDMETRWLIHGEKSTRCLDADINERKVFVTTCNKDSLTQKWIFENINPKAIANWDNHTPGDVL